ncbi:MAG: ECF transporter S component [Actinomycetes bacterium]|jgi:energy-coupling factor transport system substrate-specific component
MRTNDVVRFSPLGTAVLTLASLISAAGFLWPFFYSGQSLPRTQLFFWAALTVAFFLVIIQISNSALDAKSVALLGVLSALIAALRPLGAGAVGIEPMWFILILSARVFGPSFGFILGLTSMFVSALLTGGVGPWLGYQVFAAAWIGMAAGMLPGKKLRGRKEIALLVLFGIFASELFGILMDLQFWPWALGANTQLSYLVHGSIAQNLSRFITFHFASAMAWDVPRAIFTTILLLLSGQAVLSALRRTKTRAAFLQPIDFIERVKA